MRRPSGALLGLFAAVFSALAACAGSGPSSEGATSDLREAPIADVDLDTAIAAINARARAEYPELKTLTKSEFLAWLERFAPYDLIKPRRKVLLDGIARGVLAAPFSFELVKYGGYPPRLTLAPINATVIEGGSLQPWLDGAETRACAEQRVCEEGFRGSLPPRAAALPFPESVELRIHEDRAPGACRVAPACQPDILVIELRLTPANLEDAVGYFAHGFDPVAIRARAQTALAQAADGWVRIEALLPNWVGAKASTYPGREDNEVCHGPARQFFLDAIENGPWDRSTEATSIVLERYYCPLADDAPLGFGDYLYIAGAHSGRYILEDPATHRAIAFSVQSGGYGAYRFWWVDEDFSGHPFDHAPLPDFREKLVDVWRRCR